MIPSNHWLASALALALAAVGCAKADGAPAQTSDDHAAHAAAAAADEATPPCHGEGAAAAKGSAAKAAPEKVDSLALPNAALVNQRGEQVRLLDLIDDHVVVINTIFTTCTTICPPMGAGFGRLQDLVAEQGDAGKPVQMLSLSVDPVVDTPQRLDEWARRFGAKPGWSLLTGDKVEVDALLKALKVFTPNREDHAPIVLIGDPATGTWIRAYGLAPPAQLAELVGKLRAGEAVL